MKNKEIRKKIKSHYARIPDRQMSPGVYISKIGYKFVYILNINLAQGYYRSTIKKMTLEQFYNDFID